MYMHAYFLLEEFRQEYCFLPVLAGLGGMRGDVTGVGEPSEDLQDTLANCRRFKNFLRGITTTPPLTRPLLAEVDQDTSLYAFTGLVASTFKSPL